uniref:Uncharacterized protein n=1 Tax=viral metagenome TaxID=1070528 RepID=A0A6C0JMF0_9ZZZZ
MDSQFNSLIQSFNSNYVQYKVTGNPSYQTAYEAAQEGLDSIVKSLQQKVNEEKSNISDFYKSGVEQKLNNIQSTNRKLQRGILTKEDDIVASKLRGSQSLTPAITTTQYVLLGVMGGLMLALSLI